MNYTTVVDIENYLRTEIVSGFEPQIASWIGAMSRFMDQYTGRTLVSTTPETRKFDGNGRTELFIDEVNTITEVRVGDTVVTPYQYPSNTLHKWQLAMDWNVFTMGRQNVEVDGIFAKFNSLPDDIKFACTVLTAGIVNQNKNQNMDVQSERIGQYQVTYKDEQHRSDIKRAMQILDLHRRLSF